MISDFTIQQVKERAKCHEVIGDFVQLKKQGTNYVCPCPFHNEKSPSFTINPIENFYKCFGCSEAGDSIKFLEKYKQFTYQQSIEYLCNKYKIVMEIENTSKTYIKPVFKNVSQLSDNLVKWFKEKRSISQKTLIKLKIGEGVEFMPQISKEVNTIHFNYFRNDELINTKYRDSQKHMKLFKNGELIFYNIDSLIGAKEAWITEGEIEVCTLVEAGIIREGVGGVSVPNGANIKSNNLGYLDSAIHLFDKIEKIYLATDDDIAGRKLGEDLADRFGKDKCYYITYKGKKDLNEVLVADSIQGVIDCCSDKKSFPIVGAFEPSAFKSAVDDMYVKGINRGVGIGIKGFDELLRFVTGYITLITGYPNSGKSDWVDEMIVRLCLFHGWKGGLYSPENFPTELHISKLARKLIGKNWYGKEKINEQEKNLVMNFLEKKIWFIIPEKDFSIDSILKTVLMLKRQFGINFFLLDAWNRIEHKYTGNDVKYVTECLNKIDNFCKEHNLHCFLVAHPTKAEIDRKTGKLPVVTMNNISGGAQFNNIVANGISVYRDYGTFNDVTKKYDNQTSIIYVQKVKMQPYWGHQGYCKFKYDIPSGRYNELTGDNAIIDYSNWITKENRQATIEIPETADNSIEENKTGIIIGEEPPF